MAEQGGAASEGPTTHQPAEESPVHTKPFVSTVSPNGSRPSSLDLESSDSINIPTGVTQSSSDQGKKNGSSEGAAHSEDDGNGHPDGAATTTPAAVTPTTQAAAPQVEKPPDENGHPVGGGSDGVQAGQNNSSEGAPSNSAQEDTAPTLQADHPANSCLIVGAGTASLASGVPSPARQNGQNGSSGNSCELTNNRSPVPETSGQKYLAHKGNFIMPVVL